MQPQRFLFIDPSLRDRRGHNLDYARLVVADASAAGFACRIFAHANACIDPQEVGCAVERYFARAHTDAPVADRVARSFQGAFGDGVYRVARSVRRAIAPASSLAGRNSSIELSRGRAFAVEASKLIVRLAPSAQDRILLPNLLWSEAVALAEMLANGEIAGGADTQILMRFDAPFDEIAKRALAKAGEAKAITWLADTDELVECYSELLQSNVTRAPVPIDGPALRRAALAKLCPDPVVVVALGESRREKGFLLLPEMIARVLQKDSGVRFEVQASMNMPGGETGVDAAISELRRMESPKMALLPAELPSDRFVEILGTSHVLLLPYEASSYSRRSSGLLLNGLAAGLEIVAPESAMALVSCIKRNGREDQAALCKPTVEGYVRGLFETISRVRRGSPTPLSKLAEELISPPWAQRRGTREADERIRLTS